MKILFVWPVAEFSTFDVAKGLRKAFIKQGHIIEDYRMYQRVKLNRNILQASAPEGKTVSPDTVARMASEALAHKMILAQSDWVFIVGGVGVDLDAIFALKAIGGKVATFFTESPYETNTKQELGMAALCDVAITTDLTTLSSFQEVLDKNTGGVALHIPHSYDPDVHKPPEEAREANYDVTMIGTGFAYRQFLLEGVNWEGINFRLGGLWPSIWTSSHLHKYVTEPCVKNEEVIKMYHDSRLVLNPHRYHPDATATNPRTFEAIASGTLVVCDYREEIAEIFEDAIPMYTPGVPWELEAIIRRLLANDEERSNRLQRAMEAVKSHTFEARAAEISKTLSSFKRRDIREESAKLAS